MLYFYLLRNIIVILFFILKSQIYKIYIYKLRFCGLKKNYSKMNKIYQE